jgi:hypothetical protein
MYYVVKQSSYSTAGHPEVCAINLQRRWGKKEEKGWRNLIFWGAYATAIYQLLKPGTVIDISGGGIMRYPKPRQKRGGNGYGH